MTVVRQGRRRRATLALGALRPVGDAALLAGPPSFRPQLVRGWAVAGICLMGLGRLRPHGPLSAVGLRSENAAHRIAVDWDTPDGPATGVYIPRVTATRLNAAAGGRLFPEHHLAPFRANEAAGRVRVAFDRDDGTAVDVTVDAARRLTFGALFADLAEASSLFEDSPFG